MYGVISVPSRGPTAATVPPTSLCPSSCASSPLLFRWASTTARPTPRTTMMIPAATQMRCSRLKRGSVEVLTYLLQVGGQRRMEVPTAAVGVVEGELVGVEERAFHGQSVAPTVAGVPRHRMADGRQVYAHLMGTAALQVALQERGGHRVGIPLEDLIAGSRRAPSRRDGHARRLPRRAAHRRVDHTLSLGDLSEHERQVAPFDVSR